MDNSLFNKNIFLKSALTFEGSRISNDDVLQWLKEQNKSITVDVNQVKFEELNSWVFSKNKNNLKHESNGFFSIDGIRVDTNYGDVNKWDQPIINQPEIGYLGFITKEIEGVLHFLVQAKVEPGNINNVQLSPTLQATRSNYLKLHKGKAPKYLEYFQDRTRSKILIDQLQSEQGGRFLKKRNRNIIIQVFDDIKIEENFIWLTLGQIKKLLLQDNIVNMDTRTVISAIQFDSLNSREEGVIDLISSELGKEFFTSSLRNKNTVYNINQIIAWFTELKCKYQLNVDKIPLSGLKDWIIDDYEIKHRSGKFFNVIAADVQISNREVSRWMQPLIKPAQEGLIVFIIKRINGIFHFLVQAKLECGNFDTLEMAPTIQCLTGNYLNTLKGSLPYLDYVMESGKKNILFDTLQSEEGGRFFQEQNRNMIILADENFDEKIPDNFCWMTLNQLHSFLQYNNYLNIQARSLISLITL